jgi:DNA (cytosine-5)-methyltransferase 1
MTDDTHSGDDTLHVVDLFAGAGGMSTGIVNAAQKLGYTPGEDLHLAAINHDEDAIATHETNHPWADHYHTTVEALHPPDVAPPNEVDLLAGGPSCTHFSTARGDQPVKEQERASPWHMLRWIELLRPKHLLVENVGDLRSWGPVEDGEPTRDGSIYKRWIGMLHALGYSVITDAKDRYGVKLTAADYGDPTTRERLFVMASRTKRPTAPPATHSPDPDDDLEEWVPAADVIDWSDRGESMFTRSKPLKTKTMDRIARGIRDYCDERLHPYAAALESMDQADIYELQEDIVDVADLPAALDERTEPFLVRGEVDVDADSDSVPMVMGQHGGAYPRDAATEPLPTIAKRGAIHYIDAEAFVLPRNGSARGKHSNPAYEPDERPFHTVTAKNHDGRLFRPFLVQYNGEPEHSPQSIDEPLPTLTKKARYALALPDVYPWGLDLRYRMLDPSETKQAQGFPEDYEITGETKKSLRAQIGNAVPVGMATALCEHIFVAEAASLSTFGAGLSEDEDVEIPPYQDVVADGGVEGDD